MLSIGSHLPFSINSKNKTIDMAMRFNLKSFQVFIGNNKAYKAKLIPSNSCQKFRKSLQDNKLQMIVHSPYLVNLAQDLNHPDPSKSVWHRSIDRLVIDMINCQRMGASGLVVHMGKNVKKYPYTQACENMYKALCQVLIEVDYSNKKQTDNTNNTNNTNNTENYTNTKILIENVAGQGTEMGHLLKDWAQFWKGLQQYIDDLNQNNQNNITIDRFGLCIDTAHLHAAGEYDLSNPQNVDRFFEDFDNLIGWKWVKAIHYNDSMSEYSSRRDRHDDIGFGTIGKEGLKHFIKGVQIQNNKLQNPINLPIIMECPLNKTIDINNISEMGIEIDDQEIKTLTNLLTAVPQPLQFTMLQVIMIHSWLRGAALPSDP